MDNQSTSPQIIFPNVPQDFCPTGDWSEVLQQFIDIVLANGTINVPGLGDVTPSEITSINAQLSSQQLQIDALAVVDTQYNTRITDLENVPRVTIRTGTVSVPVGNSTLNVTFATLPSAAYGVSIMPVGTSTSRATMGSYVLQAGQTTTGFTLLVEDNPATVTTLRWTAIHTA
jgi:hypothetical protein